MTDPNTLTPEELEDIENGRRRRARANQADQEFKELVDDVHIALDRFVKKHDQHVVEPVIRQLLQLMKGVDMVAFTNPTALLTTPLVNHFNSGAQPQAVASTASVSQTVADKVQVLTEQLGETNEATALDKAIKLTKGLATLDQPAVAKRLDLAERIFDQSLANALEVAPGGAKLQVEVDFKTVSDQLTTANDELDKLRPVAKWAKPFYDENAKVTDPTARGVREKLALEAFQGKTPVVKSNKETDLEKIIANIKSSMAVHTLKVTQPGLKFAKDTPYRIVDDPKLTTESKAALGITT